MPSLRQRQRVPEIMDQPDLAPARHFAALRGLARINCVERQRRHSVATAGRTRQASGPADPGSRRGVRRRRCIIAAMAPRCAPAGLDVQMDGCDLSPAAVEYAQRNADACGANVRYFVQDVLHGPTLTGYDAVTCSLFLHHLEEEQAVAYLRWAAATAAHQVLVNDLIRSAVGLFLAHVVGASSPLRMWSMWMGRDSVEGAFTMQEARDLAEKAGLHGATVGWRWPFRYLLKWDRK